MDKDTQILLQTAKAAMQGLLSGGYAHMDAEWIADESVKYARALICEINHPHLESEDDSND